MQKNECVILLHGLSRTSRSMRKIESSLNANYRVINNSYPSRKCTIETLADMAIKPALALCDNAEKIHFVTHSLGGILLRQFLSNNTIENMGNAIMLGPPNNGSELVNAFRSYTLTKWLFDKVNGPAGKQLGTQNNNRPKELGAVNFRLGVIAGNVSYNPLFSKVFNGESDGKVSINSTRVNGMSDHLILPVSHTFMMNNDVILHQIRHFLTHNAFQK